MGAKKICTYEFGHFSLDPHRRLLLVSGRHVPLPPKALDLLLILIENRDRVVSKNDLMQALWPNTVVEESNVTQNIFLLRRTLGEDAREHRYIVTIPGSGYRFLPQVRTVLETGAEIHQKDGTKAAGTDFRPSIAVLPFRPLSSDPTDEYLGYGVAEAITAKLSGIPQLTVRPTPGVALKPGGSEQEPLRIGRRLGIASIIYGTLLRQGERVRITVQNVRVPDGALNWATQFEGMLREIFALQDEIATHVASAVTSNLTNEDWERLKRRQTESTDAYLCYVKGRYFLSKRSPEGFRKAADCFELASRLDPEYALAFAGLADCNCLLGCYGLIPPTEAWPKAKSAALRALAIDNGLAEAHATLGLVHLVYEWNWPGAERACLQALALNPNCANAYDYYAEYLSVMGRQDKAIAAIKRAQELDPLSLIINSDVGVNLYRARRNQEAVKQLENTVSMDPNFAVAHWWLGCAYETQGMYEQALWQFEEAYRLFDNGPPMLASRGHAYAASGDTARAGQVLEQLLDLSRCRFVSPFDMAITYVGLGDKEEAFNWLEKAYLDRPWQLIYINADPRLDPIRSDARFKDLVHRIGLAGA